MTGDLASLANPKPAKVYQTEEWMDAVKARFDKMMS